VPFTSTKSSYFHIADASRVRFHSPVTAYHRVLLLEPQHFVHCRFAKFLFVFVNQVSQDQPSESTPKYAMYLIGKEDKVRDLHCFGLPINLRMAYNDADPKCTSALMLYPKLIESKHPKCTSAIMLYPKLIESKQICDKWCSTSLGKFAVRDDNGLSSQELKG
jgi:hypothetical protein